jgi:hypothetical protein
MGRRGYRLEFRRKVLDLVEAGRPIAEVAALLRCGVRPHCSFCGTSTGPFSEVEGLFTVLICIPCLTVRQAPAGQLLALHDPGQPWLQWGCPIEGCGRWVIGPWELEGHTEAEHPGWIATYELLRPYPNQRQRVVYQRSAAPTSERPAPAHPPTSPPPTQHGHDRSGDRTEHREDQAKSQDGEAER